MPFISTVKILEDKPDLSRWTLKHKAFGQNIEFFGLLAICSPFETRRSTGDLLKASPIEELYDFTQKSPSCTVELTVSYEVPPLLSPVASALQPFLESLFLRGLERFAKFAGTYPAST